VARGRPRCPPSGPPHNSPAPIKAARFLVQRETASNVHARTPPWLAPSLYQQPRPGVQHAAAEAAGRNSDGPNHLAGEFNATPGPAPAPSARGTVVRRPRAGAGDPDADASDSFRAAADGRQATQPTLQGAPAGAEAAARKSI